MTGKPVSMKKDPDAVLPFTVDWSEWLANEGDTAATATWTVPDGITKESDTLADGKATIWLSGGTAAQKYEIVCHLTTDGGRQDDRTLIVRVENR